MELAMLTRACWAVAIFLVLNQSHGSAQVVLDVSKLTCWQFATYKVADPKLIAVWISGFQHGKRGDMLVDTEKLDADAEKLRTFCISNPDMPVMEAVEKVVGEAGQ
jgi:acid stress chaperone HdeB